MDSNIEPENGALVSVIIPTYNRLEYLQEALKSVVQQTYQNLEIIVSDNCSPEDPQAMVAAFQDPRIRFYRQRENVGMFANVQSAFLRAKGKYIASLLDDDAWEPTFLEKLVLPLEEHPDLAVAFCDHYMVTADGIIDEQSTTACSQTYKRLNLRPGIHPSPIDVLCLVDRSVSTAMAAVMRRDVVDWARIPPESGVLWDMYVGYVCASSGLGAYYCPERLTRVREHDQSETLQSGARNVNAKIRKGKAQVFFYDLLLRDQRLKTHWPVFQQRLAQASTTLGIGLMRAGQVTEARPFLWRSLGLGLNLRSVMAWLVSFLPPKLACRF